MPVIPDGPQRTGGMDRLQQPPEPLKVLAWSHQGRSLVPTLLRMEGNVRILAPELCWGCCDLKVAKEEDMEKEEGAFQTRMHLNWTNAKKETEWCTSQRMLTQIR